MYEKNLYYFFAGILLADIFLFPYEILVIMPLPYSSRHADGIICFCFSLCGLLGLCQYVLNLKSARGVTHLLV